MINKRKTADIQKYNMGRIDHAVSNGGSLKAVKGRLGKETNQMYALKDKQANVITNRDKIVIVASIYTVAATSRIIKNEDVVERR